MMIVVTFEIIIDTISNWVGVVRKIHTKLRIEIFVLRSTCIYFTDETYKYQLSSKIQNYTGERNKNFL